MLSNVFRIILCTWLFLCITACQHSSEEHLSIAFAGDVLLDRGVRQQINKRGVEYLFTSVAPIFHASDAAVINLECPVTSVCSPLKEKYIFRAEPTWLEALKKSGVTHTAMANNHTIDQGRSGLIETYKHLTAIGITPLGYGETQTKSSQPIFIEKRNIKVALFNSVLLPLENWVYLEDSPGICQQPISALRKAIRAFKQKHPDYYVVVILHWGQEYQTSPSTSQRRDAHQLIKAGADAIIGHHPHVIQPEEYIDGKPVFYSLGNFVFDQRKPETSRSRIVVLDFTSRKCNIRVYPVTIKECKPKPWQTKRN